MRRILTALFGVALLILALGAMQATTIFAHEEGEEEGEKKSKGKYKTAVLDVSGNEVGEAELKLKDGRVKIKVKTEDLAPGHVFSIWGIINHQPAISLYGFISDDDGEAKFVRRVELDENLELYRFKIVLKDHGLPMSDPWQIEEQKSTKGYGCGGEEDKCPSVRWATFEGL